MVKVSIPKMILKNSLSRLLLHLSSTNELSRWFPGPGSLEIKIKFSISTIQVIYNFQGISCEIAFMWISLNLVDDKSMLVMAWCCQAASHYLSQCWPRSVLPYGITSTHWVHLYGVLQYMLHALGMLKVWILICILCTAFIFVTFIFISTPTHIP